MLPPSLQAELASIESVLSQYPAGLTMVALEVQMGQLWGVVLPRRTLQRRLERLQAAGRVVAEGASVARVYKPKVEPAAPAVPGAVPLAAAPLPVNYVPLSPEGAAVRERVIQPLMHRLPVGYQRAFLESYEPGVSFYLPALLRQELHAMGRTSVDARPAGTYAREVFNRLLVDLSWASSKLEGNTYSRLDTQNLIEHGQIAEGKDALETQMILNHKAAIEMLIEGVAQEGQVAIDPFTFQNLHAVLSQDLLADPQACGRLRRRPVEIPASVFLPLAMPQVLEDSFRLLLRKAQAIADPFEQAFFLMVQLPYLQPFEDVNKRVSRLGANIPLLQHNLCPLAFIDVPEAAYVEGTLGVYELNRVELLRDVFVWAYERSCQRYMAITQSLVTPDPLKIRYREALIEAVQAVVKGPQSLIPLPQAIAQWADQCAAPADQPVFAQMLTEALAHLHEGSVARYRLRRSEFLAWTARRV